MLSVYEGTKERSESDSRPIIDSDFPFTSHTKKKSALLSFSLRCVRSSQKWRKSLVLEREEVEKEG